MQQAVFLDRDNTLILNDGDLGDPGAVRLMDGVPEGLKALRAAGYRLIVVTNQAGVARGVFTEDDVDAVHQRIAVLVDEAIDDENLIDRFYYCPYHPDAPLDDYRRDHPWRKPHPGMLLQAARDLDLDLAQSWMVGDQERDMRAGRSAGCRTALLAADGDSETEPRPTTTAASFSEAVQAILRASPPVERAHETAEQADEDEEIDPPSIELLITQTEAMGSSSASPRTTTAVISKPEPRAAGERKESPARPVTSSTTATDLGDLKRVVSQLIDEIRVDRIRRAEFTPIRLAAGLCQLLVLLLALLGLLQLGTTDVFMKWMIGAALVQLLTVAILLMDLKG